MRIAGNSAATESIRAFGRRAAPVDAPVLLLGESGTGKGVLAQAIHDASPRARKPFIAVNCAAIPESLFESEFFGHVRGAFTGAQYAHRGLFEQADGGTLFLDEIGELPLGAQAKLLTTIEDLQVRKVGGERHAPVNVRIIAATACDLRGAVAERRFRNDLFHRLRVLHFTIPPLRQRYGDIALLASLFLARCCERYHRNVRIDDAAMRALENAPWPGNIRELAHTVESAVLAAIDDVVRDITFESPTSPPTPSTSRMRSRYSFAGSTEDEWRTIELALQRCNGNKTRAAFELGMSRNTLLNKLRRMTSGFCLILLFEYANSHRMLVHNCVQRCKLSNPQLVAAAHDAFAQ